MEWILLITAVVGGAVAFGLLTLLLFGGLLIEIAERHAIEDL